MLSGFWKKLLAKKKDIVGGKSENPNPKHDDKVKHLWFKSENKNIMLQNEVPSVKAIRKSIFFPLFFFIWLYLSR